MIAKWKEAYPAVDIWAEIHKAESWLLSNPKNKKSNYPRFLTGWLSRTQDRAPRVNGGGKPHAGQAPTSAEREGRKVKLNIKLWPREHIVNKLRIEGQAFRDAMIAEGLNPADYEDGGDARR